MKDFALWYPLALFLRDEQQRSLHHVDLSSGVTIRNDPFFILRMRDEEFEERDPVTGLYPFMIAASADECDLYTIHSLFRINIG